MSGLQTSTNENVPQIDDDENVEDKIIKGQQEQWITFCALGGLVTTESDDPDQPVGLEQITITQFSQQLGVHRTTLYNWKNSIPNFGQRVRSRRAEVFSLSRESAAFNRLYLIGMNNKDMRAAVDALKTILGHFSKLELATQRHEVEAGQNLMDLVNAGRRKRVIEGESSGSDSNA
jgi:hypothetical protein